MDLVDSVDAADFKDPPSARGQLRVCFQRTTNMNVLVVEDSKSTQLMLEKILTGWGHEVTCIADGNEALRLLAEKDISLVMVDWLMPVMDGIELVQHIRNRDWGRYIYVLMLTILGERRNLARAMEAGVDDYATKPINHDELHARLKAATRILELEQRLAERVRELEEHVRTIRQLKGLLPICSYCSKIRDEDDQWQPLDWYIHRETGAYFSHTICPDCYEKHVKPQLEALERDVARRR